MHVHSRLNANAAAKVLFYIPAIDRPMSGALPIDHEPQGRDETPLPFAYGAHYPFASRFVTVGRAQWRQNNRLSII